MSYESLSPLSISSDTIALGRRQDEPLPTHRFQITGFAVDDSPKHDIIANHYENGETVLHLPLREDSGKRSKLTQAHQKSMALAGAATWAVYADNANHKMDDFIGFAETEHAANFYYRIIPEIKGFGTNYETVDICGGMASYL
ncbi:hypothetical protein BDV27DRAFT_154334 [Aspergillus caelatus]|uniref:Uncharacterized protein n=1 Tax=Aspergillus caelatus TaxID=61420 RepID=A0A5N7AHN2_9EURO|nr:uncharacterized protein BDV27DRAFT_154334 [Aspergillus caelatus]KAE8368170.1 hypothetical protein BDV27DRAFT_154334 [Aspergillus caelatus]